MKLEQKTYFARGKRGLAYTALLNGERVLVKVRNPDATVDTIAHEAMMLKRVNEAGLGPRFIAFDERSGELVREFIDGAEICDALENMNKAQIKQLLIEIFKQCRKLDILLLNKEEMTRPYKHLLVTTKRSKYRRKGDVVQIDWERCRHSRDPKNVSQFAQTLYHGKIGMILKEKEALSDDKKNMLLVLIKRYKQKLNNDIFYEIVGFLGDRDAQPSFAERVYEKLCEVPRSEVTTYRDLALALGIRSPRAIGQVLRRNPYAPIVPCHRVVASDGTIGGFGGERTGPAIEEKRRRLAEEEVVVENARIQDFEKRKHKFS